LKEESPSNEDSGKGLGDVKEQVRGQKATVLSAIYELSHEKMEGGDRGQETQLSAGHLISRTSAANEVRRRRKEEFRTVWKKGDYLAQKKKRGGKI